MSQLGYQIGDDGIDTYGVNHNDFTINDELRYQTARIDRENQLINSYNNMGIKGNYPIYTTNFWGSTSDNNYGFGNMNIREAIDNHTGINQSPLPMMNLNQNYSSEVVPSYWEGSNEGKMVYDNVVKHEGYYYPQKQNIFNHGLSVIKGGYNLAKNFKLLNNSNYTDKYKHAYMNCEASQYGEGGYDIVKLASNLKEWNDVRKKANTIDSSQADQYANKIGRLLGSKYSKGDCDELVQRYIKKNE